MAEEVKFDVTELPHVKLINEENVDIKTLPASLRQKIGFISARIKQYVKKPSKAQETSITTSSVKLADAIQDHLEDGLPDQEPNQNNDMKDDKKPDAATAAPVEPPADPAATTPPATPEPAPANPEPAKPKKELVKGDSGKANKIYAELNELIKQNKTSVSMEELKKLAPISYSVVFDTYKDDEENGIEIGDIQLKETEKEKFTITK